MKEKRVVLMIVLGILVLITLSLVLAADEADIEKSYTCLKNKLGSNCGGSDNIETLSYNLLAMSYDSQVQSDCKSEIEKRKNDNCYAQSSGGQCSVKSTAIAVFALNEVGEKVDDSIDWLLSRRMANNGLTWFLEIDANNLTECEINGKTVTINENKKITGNVPGLKLAYNNYWFQIDDIDSNYTITCKNDFVTTLLYQKPGSSVIYVTSNSHTASAGDTTTEKVNSYCFISNGECNYEATLWVTLSLVKTEEDISPYIPYLTAFSDDSANSKYFPSAFLYMLTGSDDYEAQIRSLIKEGKYWDISNNKFYDTSLAILALGSGSSLDEVENSKNYLLGLRETDGCWNNVYMPLILYAGWPRIPVKASTGTSSAGCTDYSHYCVAALECPSAKRLDNFMCLGSDICCETNTPGQTCTDKGGMVCKENQICTGETVSSADENNCCTGNCNEQVAPTQNECETSGGTCKDICGKDEEEKTAYSNSCDLGYICCGTKETTPTNWFLIILIIILIILVLLAIIFRNQVRVWLFRTKSGFRTGKSPPPSSRPGPFIQPPFRPMPPSMQQRAPQHMYGRLPPRPPVRSQKDKEFDDTMRKLRDISK